MNFAKAIEVLKRGGIVARGEWAEKPTGVVYVWLKPGASIKSEWCKDPILKKEAENNGGQIEGEPVLCARTNDATILSGWRPSAADILAEDWLFV